MRNWYNRAMPHIKDVDLSAIENKMSTIDGIKKAYVWGEFAQKNKEEIIKQIDILAITDFQSEDLSSIINGDYSPLKIKEEQLEDEGFNKKAVNFTKKIIALPYINPWCVAKDNSILHWGPIVEDKEDLKTIEKDAEDYAKFVTGSTKKQLKTSSQQTKDKWDVMYHHYINKYLKGIPKGWYTLDYKLADILSKAKELNLGK